ncbi:MAG: class I SAM-dependent methyltransferase [Planctomycetes bacterium]|nr:class I SAM-dependent methyltransferase [Planctomycetota bacterium]
MQPISSARRLAGRSNAIRIVDCRLLLGESLFSIIVESQRPMDSDTPIEAVPTREGYDRWADIYDAEDNALIALEEPRVIELLGEVANLDIVDLGAGTGRHAVRLAAAGARVTAVEFSEGMVEKARAKPGADRVRFLLHDLSKPLPLSDASFDRVLSCLVLEHITNLELFFSECRRICRPSGFVLFSAMHPAMMLRGISARFTDPDTGREVRPTSHPHQISDFLMAAVRAGLHLDHISEHAVDEALAARSPRAAKYLGWPMLLMMRFCP